MESTPAIVENSFSSGVATEAAIVSGLAPGSDALTWMVGKSTLGRSYTGRPRYANHPKKTNASITSVVITGRRMKSAERFNGSLPCPQSPRRSPAPSRREKA
jgi:hypothetical protein